MLYIQILDEETDLPKRSCPSFDNLLTESIRKPLKNMVDGLCPNRKSRIEAREFAKVFQVIYLIPFLFGNFFEINYL